MLLDTGLGTALMKQCAKVKDYIEHSYNYYYYTSM